MADIFSDIFKFAGTVINQAITPDNLRDRRHASKLFVDDQYRLLPKMGYLFHVYFDINFEAAQPDLKNPNRDREIGLLVKSVSLPKFSIDTKKYNAYNRPNYIQSKVNYDPINITFHDDSADVIRNFWFDYYNYYYRDSDYIESLYGQAHKYEAVRQSDKWGYSPRNTVGEPYLRSIRIYSLHQKRFSEYVLLNPIIKSFRHGDHQQGSNEPVQHDMTIEYESVLYYYGSTSPETVSGFATLHYDKTPSPLTPAGGGTKSILGPGGLLDTGNDVVTDLKDGNYGAALFKAAKGLKTAQGMDLKSAAISEVLAIGTGVLRGNNPQNNIFVPSLSNLGGSTNDTGSRFGLGNLISGSGIGGGNSWLAGAAGLGVASLAGQAPRNQEMSDATSYNDGQAPYSSYDDLPTLEDEENPVPAYNTSDYSCGPLTLSEAGFVPEPTDQGTVEPTLALQNTNTNITVARTALHGLKVEKNTVKEQQQLTQDTIDALSNKKKELLELGYTDKHAQVVELTRQIDTQLNIANIQKNKLSKIDNESSKLALTLQKHTVLRQGLI